MKTINLDFELKHLNGTNAGHAGQLMAEFLSNEVKGNSIKYVDWAIALYKKEAISVDDADLSKLKSILEGTENMIALAKGQLLKYLETVK